MKKARRSLSGREEAVYVELLRTTDLLSRSLAQLLKPEDISSTQYNVLRILRGSPQGLTCGEIGARMITRDPDITRLLDRLEKRNLITRWRDSADRRTVFSRITPEGLKLLHRLDAPVQAAHKRQLGHLSSPQLFQLADLLELARKQVA
jgi:DNA-binding MarR family transcriptional regulator